MERGSWLVVVESVALLGLSGLWLVRSGATGSEAALDVPRPAAYAADAGAAPGAKTTPLGDRPRGESVDGAVARHEAGGASVVVRGRILAADGGEGPKEASVWFKQSEIGRVGTVVGGEYAAAGLRPGLWRAHVQADGWVRYEREHAVHGSAQQTLDLVLERAQRLPVFLRTPDGQPLVKQLSAQHDTARGLWVIASEEPVTGDLPLRSSETVGDVGCGRYRSGHRDGMPGADGELQLDRAPPLYGVLLLRHVVLAQQPIAVGQQQLTFTVDPEVVNAKLARVTLRIVDGVRGQPISKGGWASLMTAQGGGVGHRKLEEAGRVGFDHLLPGILTLEVGAVDREQLRTTLRVEAGADHDLGDFVLQAPVSISGRVLDLDRRPLAATLSLADADRLQPGQELMGNQLATTDGDGEFTLHAGPRRWIVVVRTRDQRSAAVLVDARGGAPKPIEIRVPPAVRIVVTGGRRPQDVYLLVLKDDSGMTVETRRLDPRWPEQVLTWPSGDYVLEVWSGDDRLLRTLSFEARAATIRVQVP